MLHLLAANYDWHHHITPTSEEIRVFATIFPMVCLAFLNAFASPSADDSSRMTYSSALPGATSTLLRVINTAQKSLSYHLKVVFFNSIP